MSMLKISCDTERNFPPLEKLFINAAAGEEYAFNEITPRALWLVCLCRLR